MAKRKKKFGGWDYAFIAFFIAYLAGWTWLTHEWKLDWFETIGIGLGGALFFIVLLGIIGYLRLGILWAGRLMGFKTRTCR